MIATKDAVGSRYNKQAEVGSISKVEMARRMRTRGARSDRLLAPGTDVVTLQTLGRAEPLPVAAFGSTSSPVLSK